MRRACALLSVARSALRYESRLVRRDAPVLAAMRELAAPDRSRQTVAERIERVLQWKISRRVLEHAVV
jgi:hypothetical protein